MLYDLLAGRDADLSDPESSSAIGGGTDLVQTSGVGEVRR